MSTSRALAYALLKSANMRRFVALALLASGCSVPTRQVPTRTAVRIRLALNTAEAKECQRDCQPQRAVGPEALAVCLKQCELPLQVDPGATCTNDDVPPAWECATVVERSSRTIRDSRRIGGFLIVGGVAFGLGVAASSFVERKRNPVR